MRLRQHASILAVFLFLAGCASQPGPETTDRNWQDRLARVQQLDHWQANGKIALRNTERAESGSMTWTQVQGTTRLDLSGPLGVGATTIHSDGHTMEVIDSDGSNRYDISTGDAIIRETGWDLPVQALHYWLKGIPAPELKVKSLLVEEGLLKQLDQSGWTISYESYRQFGSYTLPTKLKIERAETRARLIIRNWTIEAA